MNQGSRGNWYLLTGLLIGLGLGLAYAWLVSPVDYTDTEPASLAAPYKEAYRVVIALAYQSEGDIGRARERLRLIDSGDPVRALAAQAQRMIAANAPASEARALSVLASDLSQPGKVSSVAQANSPTPESPAAPPPEAAPTLDPGEAIRTATLPAPTNTPTPEPSATITQTPPPTNTPRPTFTPRPTSTPRIIPDAPFALTAQTKICDGSLPAGLLQVEVTGADNQPLPGVKIVVSWQGGENVFYTGLAPDISAGYADFKMSPGLEYTVKVGDASQQAAPIAPQGACAWRLEYNQE